VELTKQSSKLTRAELINHIVDKFDIHKLIANEIIKTIFEDIKQALAQNRIVELRSFGTFEIHQRKSRKSRNPRSREVFIAPPKKKVYFRSGQELKKMMNPPDAKLNVENEES